MSVVGTVESLWRYPVKSMRGEELEEIFVGDGGVDGDRLFAFRSSAARPEFPYFTAREQSQMLRCRPRYRPRLLADQPNEPMVDVEIPSGEVLAIDDPALVDYLLTGVDEKHHLTLMRSARAITDTQPISIISVQTAGRLAEESATAEEKRRFRANIYLDLRTTDGFAENDFVGQSLRLGSEVVVSILARDSRCMVITLHPDTAVSSPAVLKKVAQAHGGTAGVYAAVAREGRIQKGDSVELID